MSFPAGGNSESRKRRTFAVGVTGRNSDGSVLSEGRVVQLDRIPDFGSGGWGFESSRGH